MVRFLWGRLASKLGLHAMLGQRWSSVTASLVRHDRVVAADLCVAKGGGGGHGLCVARQQGLARLEGWDMRVGIMWWRGGGLRTWHCKGSLALGHKIGHFHLFQSPWSCHTSPLISDIATNSILPRIYAFFILPSISQFVIP